MSHSNNKQNLFSLMHDPFRFFLFNESILTTQTQLKVLNIVLP